MNKMKIWFMGGGEFAASCLEYLSDMSASLKNAFLKFEKIVTGEPTKAGRGLKESVSAVERAAYVVEYALRQRVPAGYYICLRH